MGDTGKNEAVSLSKQVPPGDFCWAWVFVCILLKVFPVPIGNFKVLEAKKAFLFPAHTGVVVGESNHDPSALQPVGGNADPATAYAWGFICARERGTVILSDLHGFAENVWALCP